MKAFAVLLSLLALGSAAVPWKGIDVNVVEDQDISGQQRIISGQIVGAIEQLSERIRENGLDPYRLERVSLGYALPVPVILDVASELSELVITGLSDIVINDVGYAIFTSRLTLDISLPRIEATLSRASLDFTILGTQINAATSFKVAINDIRIAGRIQMNVGIISGIFIRSSNLALTLGGTEFQGEVDLLGNDFSVHVEKFVTVSIPNQISASHDDINELINIIVVQYGNSILN